MPTFLSDPAPTVYAIVAVMAIALWAIYLRSRKKKDLFSAIGGVAVLLAIFLIDRFVESPREESTRKMQEMSALSANKNWDDMFKHVSDSFNYKSPNGGQTDKKTLLQKVKSVEAYVDKGFVAWDFSRNDFKQMDDKTVELGFRAQAKDRPETVVYVKATFVKDPDGQWRLGGFICYEPVNTKERRAIPGLD